MDSLLDILMQGWWGTSSIMQREHVLELDPDAFLSAHNAGELKDALGIESLTEVELAPVLDVDGVEVSSTTALPTYKMSQVLRDFLATKR